MTTVVRLRAPQAEMSTVPTVRGGRGKNAEYRQREYLTEGEIDSLLATAGNSRNPVRDRLLILLAYRHALRVSRAGRHPLAANRSRYRDRPYPPRQERHARHPRFAG